jgi:Protein of unknown function (DUF3341)
MSTQNNTLKFLLGKYKDPDSTCASVKALSHEGIKVYDVYSPFPIHGMEKLLGFKRSRLTVAAFFFGMTGTCLAILMQVYMLVWDWPVDIGGKPHFQGPALVPITFELTVLFAAFGMVFTFLLVNKMFPWKTAVIFDQRQTDDTFVVAIDQSKIKDRQKAESILTHHGAFEIAEQEVNDPYFDVF